MAGRRRIDGLSDREREIVELMATGKRDKEIGEILCLSAQGVCTHVHNARLKLHARNRPHLVYRAIQEGFLQVQE